MTSKIKTILIIASLVVIGIVALSNITTAVPPAPTVPPLPPSSGGSGSSGGGSSGGSNSYSAPVFTPYTMPLHSSDGSIIGSLVGKDVNSVMLTAEKNGTIDNQSYDLTITGELSQKPPENCWLDINFDGMDNASIPAGMNNAQVLSVVNVTHFTGYGWNVKSNTLKYTIKISGSNIQNLSSDNIYYLIWPNGENYLLQKVNIDGVGSGNVTFDISPQNDNGLFTLVSIKSNMPTPTPTPTAIPTSTPTPTPTPSNDGIGSIAILLVMFVVGAIAGAAILFLISKHK